jgi:HD-GYP domain-containing protein (c-di-GMP phosphodiesterase class II)
LIDAEIEILKNHVITGYEILKALQFPWTVADFVLQHHERENGSGYPHQLMSKDIFLEAKIIAVADTVEAMTSHRPYRQAPGIELALAEIEQGSGTLYDPLVVATCLRLFREKNYQFPSHKTVLYQALPQRVKVAS